MNLIFRFRVIFEDSEDVERIIDVAAKNTFRDFHDKIQESIGFDKIKRASFYKTNDNWRPGEEFCTDPKPNAKAAGASSLGKFIDDPHQKFLYIYDAEGGNWQLRAEIMRLFKAEQGLEYPIIFKSSGEAPKQYLKTKDTDKKSSAKLFKEADDIIAKLTDEDEDEDEDEQNAEDERSEFNLFGDDVDESEIDQSQISDGAPDQ